MEYDEIYKILPKEISNIVKQYLQEDAVQEIRIKSGKPVILNLSYGEKVLDYRTTSEDLKFMMAKVSNYSLYAFEEVSFDDLNSIEDEYVEIKCDNCDKPLFVEQQALNNNSSIPCPFCGGKARE